MRPIARPAQGPTNVRRSAADSVGIASDEATDQEEGTMDEIPNGAIDNPEDVTLGAASLMRFPQRRRGVSGR